MYIKLSMSDIFLKTKQIFDKIYQLFRNIFPILFFLRQQVFITKIHFSIQWKNLNLCSTTFFILSKDKYILHVCHLSQTNVTSQILKKSVCIASCSCKRVFDLLSMNHNRFVDSISLLISYISTIDVSNRDSVPII